MMRFDLQNTVWLREGEGATKGEAHGSGAGDGPGKDHDSGDRKKGKELGSLFRGGKDNMIGWCVKSVASDK